MSSEKITVLILGYGAREHALAWKIAQSPRMKQIYVAPGNAGTAEIAINVPISDEDIPGLVEFALENQIDLTVVGTNDPLALGAVDAFQAAGLAIFGPTQAAARLESSKAFAKAFMQRQGIATPDYATFSDYDKADAYLDSLPEEREIVVKVSGLGKQGMGVSVCDNRQEAKEALRGYMVDDILGKPVDAVVIEERIHGAEVSVFALSDGKHAVPLMPVRDYKRIYDHDQGPNTGGVGAFGPPPDIDGAFVDDVMRTVIQPTIEAMAVEGNPYVGVLYAGLMLTRAGVQVLEFNCRFGNPEALIIMSLLENDLVELMLACIEGDLPAQEIQFRDDAAVTVVVTSPQYPAEEFPVGFEISGIEEIADLVDVHVFHHGTKMVDGQLVTLRGRVLAVVAVAGTLSMATRRAYKGVKKIVFEGMHYRKDVGCQPSEEQVSAENPEHVLELQNLV